tara:strand:- start:336 stop:794 length:459 start_codon:yes stop_codon:yes gene_type:complete
MKKKKFMTHLFNLSKMRDLLLDFLEELKESLKKLLNKMSFLLFIKVQQVVEPGEVAVAPKISQTKVGAVVPKISQTKVWAVVPKLSKTKVGAVVLLVNQQMMLGVVEVEVFKKIRHKMLGEHKMRNLKMYLVVNSKVSQFKMDGEVNLKNVL